MMTKPLDYNQLLKLTDMLNLKVLTGRAAAAPELTKYLQDGDLEVMTLIEAEFVFNEG